MRLYQGHALFGNRLPKRLELGLVQMPAIGQGQQGGWVDFKDRGQVFHLAQGRHLQSALNGTEVGAATDDIKLFLCQLANSTQGAQRGCKVGLGQKMVGS